MGSSFGKLFRISTWGESHGEALGVVIDGCPAGVALNEGDIQKYLARRQTKNSNLTTKRKEPDEVKIMSGVFDSVTTGTPISLVIFNSNQNSKDYKDIADIYRPAHADFSYDQKYEFRDYRGGGRSSGRETVARVAAGSVAKKILEELDIHVDAYTISIGNIHVNEKNMDETFNNPLYIPCEKTYHKAKEYLEKCVNAGDSVGGIVECVVKNVPAGIGEPVFEKLDAVLSMAIMSIGGTKGIEFGLGFQAATALGSENNDSFYIDSDNKIKKHTNNSGGVLGGISDGDDIIFRVAFKPTPSIKHSQQTVNKNKENVEISIDGRHDPCIVPRSVVVVEAMTYITILDFMLQNSVSKISNIKKLYR